MPLTVEQFLSHLANSELISPDEVSSFLAEFPGGQHPSEGEALARELVKQKKLTKFQAEQIYAGKGKSLILGNYVLLDKLGQGGMGMVLKAKHKRMGRVVALKVMSPAAVKSVDAVKRFHREVQTAAKLTHPNIVTAFDADEAKGTHFLVMEYVEGNDLSQLVKKHGPLSVEQAIECMIQAARGLGYAHTQGVIHRDIKPANLLLDKHGTVKILDMGLARLDSGLSDAADVSSAGLTQSGAIMGTVDYMSPEQAEDTRHADARSDIYSLGCSLFFLLTGHVVYGGETMMRKLLAHRDAPIPSLTEESRRVGRGTRPTNELGMVIDGGSRGLDPPYAALNSIFRKMIAKKPSDRYQSMSDVIGDLERCRAGQSVTVNVAAVSDESAISNELQNFLRQISGGSSGEFTSATSSPLGMGGGPVDHAAETMLLTANGSSTDPQTELSLGTERLRSKRRLNRQALMAAAVVVVLFCGWLIFRTPYGAMRVEITDEQTEVTFGETGRPLRGPAKETIPLPIGPHVLHVKVGETTLDTPEITVAKGTPVEIKVEMVGNRVRVMRGNEFLVAKELTRKTINGSKVGNADSTADVAPQFALEFDGQTSYVGLPNIGLSSVKPFTAEAWVRLSKLTEPADGAIVVGSGLLLSRTAKGTWNFHINGMKGDFSSDTEAIVGEWVHLAAVWDGSSRALYVDGRRQQASEKKAAGKKVVDSPPRETTTEISLGSIPRVGKSEGTRFLSGQLREVRISSVARYQYDFQPAQRFTPDKNTLGLYHFDEGDGATLKDSSNNNHHGKIVGAKWIKISEKPQVPSPSGSNFALEFQSGENQVAIDGLSVPDAGAFTWEGWVTPKQNQDAALFAVPVADGEGLFRISIWKNGPAAVRVSAQKNAIGKTSSQTLPNSGTFHLAITYSGDTWTHWVNGKKVGQGSDRYGWSNPVRQKFPAKIGADWGVPIDEQQRRAPFEGRLDEVRISKIPRYTSDFIPATRFDSDKDTIALYHFDEGSGDVLRDSSGNSHHGKIAGAKWVRMHNALVATPSADGALLFEGNGNVEIDTPPDLNPISVTIEAYVRVNASAPRGSIYQMGGNHGLGLDFETGTRWRLSRLQNPSGHFSAETTAPIELERRVHVAGVCSADKFLVFVDGKLAATSSSVRDRSFNPGKGPHRIGSQFQGLLDELRVSKIPRYDREFTPAPRLLADKDTLALYHFNEGQGDVLKDSSGNNHHGKIIGAKWVRASTASDEPSSNFALNPAANPDHASRIEVALPRVFTVGDPMTIEMFATPRSMADATESRALWTYAGKLELKQYADKWSWQRNNPGEKPVIESVAAPIEQLGKRVHLAAVSSGAQIRLFVDGRLVGSREFVTPLPPNRGAPIYLVPSGPGDSMYRPFDGTIDEVRISRTARYSADFKPPLRHESDADTLMLFHCDEGSGDVLKDSSGNNHHGQIVGAKWVEIAP